PAPLPDAGGPRRDQPHRLQQHPPERAGLLHAHRGDSSRRRELPSRNVRPDQDVSRPRADLLGGQRPDPRAEDRQRPPLTDPAPPHPPPTALPSPPRPHPPTATPPPARTPAAPSSWPPASPASTPKDTG